MPRVVANMAQRKTVEKRECDPGTKLVKGFIENDKKVKNVKCCVCVEFTTRTHSIAGYHEASLDLDEGLSFEMTPVSWESGTVKLFLYHTKLSTQNSILDVSKVCQ